MVIQAESSPTGILQSSSSQRSLFRVCQKAKRVRFFKNGDQFFKGIWCAVSLERFRSFDALLLDLTKTLDDLITLPFGVRFLFSLDGSQKVLSLEELQDGESYVCSSNEVFKKLDYENAKEPVWCYSWYRPTRDSLCGTFSTFNSCDLSSPSQAPEFVHPRIVTIIRNGIKPRKVIRMLLNKRTARSFEQVLADVTDAIKLDTGAVRKLYTLDGTQVSSLEDFFKDDYVFIAYGSERLSIDDFFLDVEEYKFLYARKSKPIAALQLEPAVASAGDTAEPDEVSTSSVLSSGPSKGLAETQSPVLRRKFLNQRLRNQKKLRPNSAYASIGSHRLKASNGQLQEHSQSPVFAEKNPTLQNFLSDCEHPLEIQALFSIGRIIGDGNFAVVCEAVCRKSGQPLALKIIDKAKCAGKEEMVDTEIRLLKAVKHSHIVGLLDHWNMESYHYVAMELVKGGDLFDMLVAARHLQEFEACSLMQCLANALNYLHAMHNIVHRDVKPENLLIYESPSGQKQLKLADFGLATTAEEPLYTLCGTPTYVAPEILAEVGYGSKVDVWAAGVILYIMLCGFPPFVSMRNRQEELFEQILMGQYSFPCQYWDKISASAKRLIDGMLQLDTEDRFSAAEILVHPWITGRSRNVTDGGGELKSLQSDARNSGDSNSKVVLRGNGGSVEREPSYYTRRRSMDELSFVR